MPRNEVTVAVDPGLAQVGIAAVQWTGTTPRVIRAELVTTKKATKKELQQIRVATDDLRRIREIWITLEVAIDDWKPSAVAIEGYSPIPGKQGHGSWKTGAVTYMLVALCWSKGIEPVIVRPSDLRRRFLQREAGTKLDIERAVEKEVAGSRDFLQAVTPSKREHVADAIGYAVLAREEMLRIRQLAGLKVM